MDKFPKFIIEDGKLILGKVSYHKDLATDPIKVKGGGAFRYLQNCDTMVFSGASFDFGMAKPEDVKACVEAGEVYDTLPSRNISLRHHFAYDDLGTLIPLFVNKKPRMMSKAEAISALKDGFKITHRFFEANEWVKLEGNAIAHEDGAKLFEQDFWNMRKDSQWEKDWSIYKEPK